MKGTTGPGEATEGERINRLRARVMPDRKGWLSTLVWNVRNAYLAWPEGKTENRSVRWMVEGFLEEIQDLERVRDDLTDWRDGMITAPVAQRNPETLRTISAILGGTYRRTDPGMAAPVAHPQKEKAAVGPNPPDVVCPYCVQWRCAKCKATDQCDCEFAPDYKMEPYWPDGSVAIITQNDTCARCKQSLADYYAEHSGDI